MCEKIVVKLYGDLGDTFGREFSLAVKTPAEAIRLLGANFPAFNKYLLDNSEPGYQVFVDSESISVDQLHYPVSSKEVIKIVPVVAGSDGGALNMIIIGVILLVATSGTYGWKELAQGGAYAALGSGLSAFGYAMVLGGISRILNTPPTPNTPNNEPTIPSYAFDGPVNTIRQGNPVPVGYGRLRVGSQVVSFGFHPEVI